MNGSRSGRDHPALSGLIGYWRGSTHLAAGPWGPERTVKAEVTCTRVAGGLAVAQSYRHVEVDGTHFEGHGIFTIDPDHQDVLWYYVDSTGLPPDVPARCTWHDGVLRVERRSDGGWTRHTLRVDGDVLTHVAELHIGATSGGGDAAGGADVNAAAADGSTRSYRPFMTSRYRRESGGAA